MNIAFLPIRKGSKGIVNKNQKILYNQPLFHFTLKASLNSKYIDKVILATDDDELIENFNFSIFNNSDKLELYRRLDENAQDHSTTESVIMEYISFKDFSPLDVFLLVQATSPLTTENDISNIILKYNCSDFDSILSVVKSPGFFWHSNGTSLNYDWRSRPRRQELTFETYKENGALYISNIKKILKAKNRLNGSIGFYIMKDYQGLDIDDMNDFNTAEKILSSLNKNT
jgi:CMP-N-acetylneuraminic acid synthetase